MEQRSLGRHIWGILSPMVIYMAVSLAIQIGALALSVSVYEYATEITAVSALCALPILCLLFYRDRKRNPETEGKKAPWQRYGLLILFSVPFVLELNNLLMVSGLMYVSETYQETATLLYMPSFPVQILCIGVIVPIAEELIFRGLIYRRLRETWPVFPAMLVSALLFGIYHGNIVQGVYGAVAGLALSFIYEAYGSLKAPIIAHMSMNLLSVLATQFQMYDWLVKNPVRMGVLTVLCATVSATMYVWMQRIEEKPEIPNQKSGDENLAV